jgi:beta-fructofuranosidase
VGSSEGLELVIDGTDKPTKRYAAVGAMASELRVFLDIGSVEVFADGGRWVATRRIDGTVPFTRFRLLAAPGAVHDAKAWTLALPTRRRVEG